jgi:hypothetical protein
MVFPRACGWLQSSRATTLISRASFITSALKRFFAVARKQARGGGGQPGGEYAPHAYKMLVVGLQRHMRDRAAARPSDSELSLLGHAQFAPVIAIINHSLRHTTVDVATLYHAGSMMLRWCASPATRARHRSSHIVLNLNRSCRRLATRSRRQCRRRARASPAIVAIVVIVVNRSSARDCITRIFIVMHDHDAARCVRSQHVEHRE